MYLPDGTAKTKKKFKNFSNLFLVDVKMERRKDRKTERWKDGKTERPKRHHC